MKLIDLDPIFIKYETRIEAVNMGLQGIVEKPVQYSIPVPTLAEAQGIRFDCPLCTAAGTHVHGCEVSFRDRGVTDDQGTHNAEGNPVRWEVSGTGFHDLTTQPSVLLQGGCGWHGFITAGDVTCV